MASNCAEVQPGIYEIFLPLPMRPTIINVHLVDCHGAWALIDTGINSLESLATLDEVFEQVGIKVDDPSGHHRHASSCRSLRRVAALHRRSHAITHFYAFEAGRANRMVTLGSSHWDVNVTTT